MNPINPQLLSDFVTFGRELIRSQDVDPLYPILKELERSMGDEGALWFTFLYMAYYNVASAAVAWKHLPQPGFHNGLPKLDIATERRNLRGNKLRPHLDNYVTAIDRHGSQTAFLQQRWGANPIHNYEAFWLTAQTLWQNGRWAAFKWSEILKKVHGWNLAAPDMRMEFCSGPKAGLMDLFGLRADPGVDALNEYGVILIEATQAEGLDVGDWETLETVLCNFHSLRAGRYYIGHDIDELQDVIEHSPPDADTRAWLYEARKAVLPHEYLGELGGWQGVDKTANRLYRDARVIYSRVGNLSHA